MKSSSFAVMLLAASLSLTACGNERDSKTESEPSVTASPTAVPTDAKPGDFPLFEPENYTFTYSVGCFCPFMGEITVTVKDGEISSSAMAVESETDPPQTDLPASMVKTLNGIITEANESQGPVEFDWPKGQAYPTSFYIDRIPRAVDDEISYTITNVTVQ